MSFFGWLANGLGTLIGVVADTVTAVVNTVRSAYDTFVGKGGEVKDVAADSARRKQDRLREVNDEIMHLRNRAQGRGGLSEQERRRWESLREERESLLGNLNQTKEVKAAEKVLDDANLMEKVEIDSQNTHLIQEGAFAETLGKKCPACRRKMKLQWRRELTVPAPSDLYWGCTGWYIVKGNIRVCSHTEPLQRSEYALMMNTSAPEHSLTAQEYSEIITYPETSKIITTRVDDLQSDLAARGRGVELATCPVHGEHMILRKKQQFSGLMDMYFLACPHWKANNQGCTFIEKLKSAPQLNALLKSQTGSGIL